MHCLAEENMATKTDKESILFQYYYYCFEHQYYVMLKHNQTNNTDSEVIFLTFSIFRQATVCTDPSIKLKATIMWETSRVFKVSSSM